MQRLKGKIDVTGSSSGIGKRSRYASLKRGHGRSGGEAIA